MKYIFHLLSIFFLSQSTFTFAQSSVIKGRVYNEINNEPVIFANVFIDSTYSGTTTDENGLYRIENLKPGAYTIVCSYIGFQKTYNYEVIVSSTKPTVLDIAMVAVTTSLNEVEISASPFSKTEESPVSMRTINASEIYRNPGGYHDISRVIQILPGVATTIFFRNDIIVRGGAPNENRFFIDGIEVPNINHFASQGSSGGTFGMINVNFIREVDFYSGAFPANRGNAMSSIMEFKQKTGNDEKLAGTFAVGSSDIGITLEGPLGKKSTFMFSARRSYLQLLVEMFKLPFIPTYNDFQYKQTFQINDKNKFTLFGLGAIDDFELNTNANEGLEDSSAIATNNYALGNLPESSQWSYVLGGNWTHFSKKSYQTIVVSRNHLNNSLVKYKDNIEIVDGLLLDYNSQEIENKFRLENTKRKNGWKWNIGIGFENVLYTNSTYAQTEINGKVEVIDFDSRLIFNKYAAFSQLSKSVLNSRFVLSLGLRTDFNDYSDDMSNPLTQFSPRFSAAYSLTEKLSANFNIARYYQLPSYVVLGYRNAANELTNKANNITYIQCDHLVGGLEYNFTEFSKITVESFYKHYSKYPFLQKDRISLANFGGNYGVIGNEPVTSTSEGRSVGVELMLQQKLSSSIYGILSYTYVRSEFKDKNGIYVPSSWDNRHMLNLTAGKKFKKNWEVGIKFRLQGGAPYTAYDVELSSRKTVWDVTHQGIPDWNRLNEERNELSHALDIRIDKKGFFKKWAINAYLDIQNVYNFQAKGQPFLDVVRDTSGNPVTDPANASAYLTKEIENPTGIMFPSLGLMIEF